MRKLRHSAPLGAHPQKRKSWNLAGGNLAQSGSKEVKAPGQAEERAEERPASCLPRALPSSDACQIFLGTSQGWGAPSRSLGRQHCALLVFPLRVLKVRGLGSVRVLSVPGGLMPVSGVSCVVPGVCVLQQS